MNRFIIFIFSFFFCSALYAQKEERNYIRKGNRSYKDSVFVDAEVNYSKALEVNPKSSVSMYNLGNALMFQSKAEEAMLQFLAAADTEKNKSKLAQIYHNMGVLLYAGQDYAKAVEAYKQSLRNNPKDDETRYNLALAQKMLKDQEQQNQNQNQDQEQKQDQQEKDQQEKKQDQQQDQQKDQQDQQQPKENEMSKENAEQMLQSVMQDEKDVQDKVKKMQQVMQGRQLEKDW